MSFVLFQIDNLSQLSCEVPQGSDLGSILLFRVGEIIKKHTAYSLKQTGLLIIKPSVVTEGSLSRISIYTRAQLGNVGVVS